MDIAYGYSWPASILTLDLHMCVDFRMKVSTTTALHVKTIDGPRSTLIEFNSRGRSSSASVKIRTLHQ